MTNPHPIIYGEIEPPTQVYVGDCREVLTTLAISKTKADLIFADPPFNFRRNYANYSDNLSPSDYLSFTHDWINKCISILRPGGAFWINIPDEWCVEVITHAKSQSLTLENWCIWHYRFGQNTQTHFINSKVHALHFTSNGSRTWNPLQILEPSDRASKYNDPRTQNKSDGFPPGLRTPLDVWYGPGFSRIQGNNSERMPLHDNQLPEAYLHRVIASTSNPTDLVIDPFLGSGTTGVIARAMNRRFIGIEISPAYAKSAFDRILSGPAHPLPL